MPRDPTLDPKHVSHQQPATNLSTVDVTGAYHPEADTTLPHTTAGQVLMDPPQIPGYVITGELARGGMGRVLAGRELALDREVAIKTLLPGADESRFITEAKITAKLPHPSIPPVHVLGTLTDCSPFLAMKLVRGKTLAEELKARPHPLHDLPRFLQIFEQIAQAVGFAHSQGIIHRDLKPANVMVGAFGEVQVMDWGLAKDLGATVSELRDRGEAAVNPALPRCTEAVAPPSPATIPYETPNQQGDQTRSGAVMGTPNYMAPEQARGEVVDARADVFALGGILCAILTGKAVFGGTTVVETVQQAAAGDTAEALSRLDACGADREVVTLAKQCLAVVASDRPADGHAVAGLVAEYRHGVEARLKQAETEKAEALVREAEGRKRRNIWLGLAASLMLGLIASGILAWWAINARVDAEYARAKEAERATSEEKAKIEAQTNLSYAKKGNEILGSVFAGLDPKVNYSSVADLLNALKKNLGKAIQSLEQSAIGTPVEVAGMQSILGSSLLGLGEAPAAIVLLEKARNTCLARLGADDSRTLLVTNNLAVGYEHSGNLARALALREETLELCKANLGPYHPDTLSTMNNLAMSYKDSGMIHKALPLLEETLKLTKAKLGIDHPSTLTSMDNLGTTLQYAGKLDLSLPLLEETLKLRKTVLGNDHLETLTSMNNLAMGYKDSGMYNLARPLLVEALRLSKAKCGNDHFETIGIMNNLAVVYWSLKQLDKSVPMFEEVCNLREQKHGRDHPDTLWSIANLGVNYKDSGRLKEAVLLLEEALQASKKFPNLRTFGPQLVDTYAKAGENAKLAKFLRELLTEVQKMQTNDYPQLAGYLAQIGMRLLILNKWDEAQQLFRECLAIREKKEPEAWSTFNTMSMLGSALLFQKKYTEAEPLLLKGYEGMKQREKSIPPQGKIYLTTALDRLIQLYTETNKPDEVKKWQAEKDKLPKSPEKK